MDKVCGTCQFAHMEVDNHDDVSIECRKYPPTIINSGSLAKFPKILPKWHCGEYSEGDKNVNFGYYFNKYRFIGEYCWIITKDVYTE